MIITLLAWIYITLLCWLWGMFIIYWLKKIANEHKRPLPHFSILCILGLAGITCFCGILSLFIPIGGGLVQFIIAAPCFLFLLKHRQLDVFEELKRQLPGFSKPVIFLLISCCLMILAVSSWKIIHPDTLAYHSQVIQWIEKYKIVPGLVHLDSRLGLQNYWFIACAVFSFKFTGTVTLTYINTAVLLWYFIFIAYKINRNFTNSGKIHNAFLWLMLLLLSIASYSQVRLTASSANPDFIAVILVWLVFYLLVKNDEKEPSVIHFLLIIFFSVFAVTIKFSVIPVLIAGLYTCIKLIRLKGIRNFLLVAVISAVMITPLLTRNIITSGYIAFPSAFPDIADTDWKYDKEKTMHIKKFVTGYARAVRSFSTEKIAAGADMKLVEWLPGWWKHLAIADKIILILLISSLLLALINFKNIFRSDSGILVALAVSFIGIIFWFIQAPNPRFGFGFIITFPAIIAALLLPRFAGKLKSPALKSLFLFTILTSGILLGAYTLYRISNFFLPAQLLQPVGIEYLTSKTIECDGLSFQLALNRQACGAITVPCITETCENFITRGVKITNGFRAK